MEWSSDSAWFVASHGTTGAILENMRIRPADDADLPGLHALAVAAETVYTPDGDVFLVAADDAGRPLGWLAGTFDGASPRLDARRTEVGRQLLEAFTAAARERGLE